ncbi:MAG: CAF17-like 4Fe-4S cluster assembly/insertion protein YgfZ [Immundisolibacter sp.]|uniref:CAF17-like 4Fe-4S cluster assembly/insertion protein YgfZ n=1 Tax=Immundisolibacter sp. TaxID=1934948 RepID=UPI003EDEE75B
MAWMPSTAPAPAAVGLPMLAGRAVLMPLDHLAVLQAGGADATDFLHGQLSNDLVGLAPDHSLLAGYCNAKGRLYGALRLWRAGDDCLAWLAADTAEAVLKRLSMFVMRSKVTLTLRDDLALLGLAGVGANDCLIRVGLPAPEDENTLGQHGPVTVLRLPGPTPRFALCLPQGQAQAIWDALVIDATPATGAMWRLLDIDAGLPTVYAPTLEAFVPQMVNLERVGGVSFRKGCYPGQEIVARMHYLGKPSRRMFRLQAAGSAPPPGTPVLDQDEREVGTVVDAQAADGGYRALAVLQINAIEAALHLAGTRPVERLTLPYALEDEAAVHS